jgi:hypothetical protein
MSKQRRSTRRHQRSAVVLPKKWLPLIIIITGMLMIGGALIVIGGGRSTVTPKVTGAPAIEVEQSFYDLGDIHFNQAAQVSYQIKNAGDQPLRILETPRVQVIEGC